MERTIKALATLVVAVHLLLTVAYNAPDSPAKQALSPALEATIGRWFPQNWRMFAPDPARSNVSVIVACLSAEGLTERQGSTETASTAWAGPWVDISAPLARAHQNSRLSAYDRFLRAQDAAARNVLADPHGIEAWVKSCKKGDTSACTFADETRRAWKRSSTRYLVRVASSYCRAVAPSSAGVGLRIRDRPAVPWSKRQTETEMPASELPLGFFPIAEDVMPSPMFESS